MSMNVQETNVAVASQNPTGWQRIASEVLGVAAPTWTVAIPAKRSLQLVVQLAGRSAADTIGIRFNADAGANYSGVDGINKNQNLIDSNSSTLSASGIFFIGNRADKKKRITGQMNSGSGNAGVSPSLYQACGVWHNSSDQITSITLVAISGNNIQANAQLDVYGAD